MYSFLGFKQHRPVPAHSAPWVAQGFVAVIALAGCSDFAPVATFVPITDPAKLFTQVTLDHRAINISTAAPYDTFRLTATPRNALGQPIIGLPAPTFRSSDTTRVWVTPDGLVRARGAASGVKVFAEVVADGNIRHEDSAFVNVTANPEPQQLATLSIQPELPEQSEWPMIPATTNAIMGMYVLSRAGIYASPTVPLRTLDVNDKFIPGLVVEYQSLNPDIAHIMWGPGYNSVTPLLPGKAGIVARTVAYGVERADTAYYTVVMPIFNAVQLNERFDGVLQMTPTEVKVRKNGYVFWINMTTKPMDIVFDDPANVADIPESCAVEGMAMCGGGNISAFDSSSEPRIFLSAGIRGRRFPVAGVYPYRSTLTGHTGRVIVIDDTTP